MEQIYHVYNRGVDKRDIFMDDSDYYRFIHDLFEFNDTAPASLNYGRSFNQLMEVELPSIEDVHNRRKRKFLVNVIALCLMPNHYHLLVMPLRDGGMAEFMRKIGTGYTNYFNEKYKRSGSLFQGRYKRVLVEDSNHFEYLGFYIHCNPLDLKYPEWRDGKISSAEEAMKYLENYKWSSLPDYLGRRNFPSVTQRELLQHEKGPVGYRYQFEGWLGDFREYVDFLGEKDLNLE